MWTLAQVKSWLAVLRQEALCSADWSGEHLPKELGFLSAPVEGENWDQAIDQIADQWRNILHSWAAT